MPAEDIRNTIHTLWDRLADFPPSAVEESLALFFSEVAALIGAENAMWGGGVRLLDAAAAETDPTFGWRAPAMRVWKPDEQIRDRILRFRKAVAAGDADGSGDFIRHVMREAGNIRAVKLVGGTFDEAAFRNTAHHRHFYEEPGIVDRLCIAFPVNAWTESHFYFDRLKPAPPFSERDLQIAAYAARGIKWFHRQLLLRHGVLAAGETFTPTEWHVVPLLLTDLTEKEIAEKLGLTYDATHKHVRGVFKKLGLRSRSGLLALWNGG
jgi:DNA-binding CsgD family transcriptional regulator